MITKRAGRGRLAILILACAVAIAATPAALLAHEGHDHLAKGTIASIAASKLVVETVDGHRNLYLLSEETHYLRGSEATTRENLVVGERVVVKYRTQADGDHATEVRVGSKKT